MGKKIPFTTTDGVSYGRFNQVMFSFTTHLVLFEAYKNNNLSQSPTCFSHLPLHPLPFKNHFDHSLCLLDVVQREKMVLVWWYFAATNYILHTFLCQKNVSNMLRGQRGQAYHFCPACPNGFSSPSPPSPVPSRYGYSCMKASCSSRR